MVNFTLGRLNVITGASKTGKSSLLDVVDYCLGSTGFPVAAGVLRSSARAFAVRLARQGEDLLIVRLAPRPGNASSTQFHIRTLDPAEAIPELTTLPVNADLSAVRSQLSKFAGIGENLFQPENGTRDPLRASIRHSIFFCLQAQDEIASRSVLFHGQADEWTPQSMRDVFPYFLGAVPDDHLDRLERARRLRREIRVLRRSRDEAASIYSPTGREQALIAEAVQVGLLDADEPGSSAPRDLLAQALDSAEPPIDLPATSPLTELLAERQDLRNRHARVTATMDNLRVLQKERADFASEAEEHRSRLSFSRIFHANGDDRCPLCSAEIETVGDDLERAQQELVEISQSLTAVSTSTPEIQALAAQAEGSLSDLDQQLRENQIAIDEVERSSRVLERYRQDSVGRAHVRGRISMFLGAQGQEVSEDAVTDRLAELERELEQLEAELDSEHAASRLASALARVGSHITAIASDLQLEHAESPARLDIQKLTVIADAPSGPIPLSEMGSGENWVGYHLAAMLGLHRFFVEAARPVPRFLMLDQPSQVYFPPEVDDPDPSTDEDRAALLRMLQVIDREVTEADGALQVVLVDHADLAADWFQSAVVEKWRDGAALVPGTWLEP